MRDQWFVLGGNELRYGRTGAARIPVVWSLDYDGASDVVRTRFPDLTNGYTLKAVKTWSMPMETPNASRVNDFWRTMTSVSELAGGEHPSLVMSGSARILYQEPGKLEQDGLGHVDMQNVGLEKHFETTDVKIDEKALNLTYTYKDSSLIHDPRDAKMDIVLKQIKYAQTKLGTERLRFVFVDDIYAIKLATMFKANPRRLPNDVTLHLVHFESFRNREGRPPRHKVTDRVFLYPF